MRTATPGKKLVIRLACSIVLLAGSGMREVCAETSTVSVQIMDEMDPAEVEETTSVFINGGLAAIFTLDAAHRSMEKTITIAAAGAYEYALCGRITVRGPEGKLQTHVLDDGAVLPALDGLRFEALAAADFTTFYLAEKREGFAGPPGDLHRTHVCVVPTS